MSRRNLLISVGVLAVSNAIAVPAWGLCTMRFNDPVALGALPDFAANGDIDQTYIEACGFEFQMALSIMQYSHWHLGYEDPGIMGVFCNTGSEIMRIDECLGNCANCGAILVNCACLSPSSIPANTFGRRPGCPPDDTAACEGIDHRLQPRVATSHLGDETFTFSVPFAFVGNDLPPVPITSACSPDGCVGGAGAGFRPRGIVVHDHPVRIVYVRIRLQNLVVSQNPPVTVTVPILAAAELPSVGPGVVDLSALGVVDRLLITSTVPVDAAVPFTVDDISIDISPFVGAAVLEPAGWTTEGGAPLAVDTTQSTNGGSSFVVPAAGWNVLRPPVVDTANQDRIGTAIAFDIFVPSAQSNPSWVGDAQMFVSVPSAGITNQPLGPSQGLTNKPRNAWSMLAFPVDAQLRQVLLTRHPDVQFSIAVNLNSNLQPTRVDNLRYAGTFTMVPPMPATPTACDAATAISLGSVNSTSTVGASACLKITSYPGSWVHGIELQPKAASQYPLPFTWSNCIGSGQGSFVGNWVQRSLTPVSTTCPTLIKLGGAGSGSFTLAWWGNG